LVFHSSTITMMHGPINIRIPNMKFQEHTTGGNRAVSYGQTKRSDREKSSPLAAPLQKRLKTTISIFNVNYLNLTMEACS